MHSRKFPLRCSELKAKTSAKFVCRRREETRLQEITQLLTSWANGNQAALAQLIPLVFDDRAIEQVAQTFQFAFLAISKLSETSLLNEASF